MSKILFTICFSIFLLIFSTPVLAAPSYGQGVVKVLQLEYYPVVDGRLDHPQVEILDGLEGADVNIVKAHVRDISTQFEQALELGTKYKGYSHPSAPPALDWQVVDTKVFDSPFPTSYFDQSNEPGKPNLRADYHTMLNGVNICDYVNQGVDYVWVWTWGSAIHSPESTMSGPHGNISNSYRDPNELPNCGKTYVLLHLNYGRGMPEALHSFGHQLEATLNHVDHELFDGKFVGDVRSEGVRRCGNVHFPINGKGDYDYFNVQLVLSDCEDWNPDVQGNLKQFNCTNWTVTGRGEDGQLFDPCYSRNLFQDGHAGWLIYWMQNMPGINNTVTYKGNQVRNWWEFVSDFDGAMAKGRTLVEQGVDSLIVFEQAKTKAMVNDESKINQVLPPSVNKPLVQNRDLAARLKGQILLQVESRGEAWYVDVPTLQRYYLKDGNSAFLALRKFGLGISNADLKKISVGTEKGFSGSDIDGDGLMDKLEEGIGTRSDVSDTDNDGYSDGVEVNSGNNPLGLGKMVIDNALVNRLKGRILLQVEGRGQAWYVNPKDGKRYYMADGDRAYQIMRYLSLGIKNTDLDQILVGELGN